MPISITHYPSQERCITVPVMQIIDCYGHHLGHDGCLALATTAAAAAAECRHCLHHHVPSECGSVLKLDNHLLVPSWDLTGCACSICCFAKATVCFLWLHPHDPQLTLQQQCSQLHALVVTLCLLGLCRCQHLQVCWTGCLRQRASR